MKKRVKRGSRVYAWATVVAVVLIGGYFLFGRVESTATSAIKPGLPPVEASDAAPPFTLSDVQGRPVSLADFRGKVVVLDFWATWCPPCKREIPDFIDLQSEYSSKGLQIVGIALDEPQKVKEFAEQVGMNYSVLLGDDATAMEYGGISGIPTTFVIDRTGKIVNRFEGYRPRSVFEQEIQKLL